MRYFQTIKTAAAAICTVVASTSMPTVAKAYQVDCAILLCLSGGWPASVECAHARTVFIRRITPWPVEPPLQIWRCPMGIAADDVSSPSQRLLDFAFQDAPPISQSYPDDDYYFDTVGQNRFNNPQDASVSFDASLPQLLMADIRTDSGQIDALKFLHLAQVQSADIDISGAEFDFVRSIRVFDVHIDDDRDPSSEGGSCGRYHRIREGSYGTQGDFGWQSAGRDDVPLAFGPTTSGCRLQARAVFVEWRDYEGHYGFERVSY